MSVKKERNEKKRKEQKKKKGTKEKERNKKKRKEQKKKLACGPRDIINVSWAFFFVRFIAIRRRRHCCSLGLLWLYPFPPREQLLAAVVLTGGVMAVFVAVVVWRQWRRYTIDKTYYYVRKNEIKQ